jgi:hypothetical protein
MRARFLLLAAAIGAPLGCTSSPSGGTLVSVVPNVVVPEDLISQIATYQVQIFSSKGGIACDATTGAVTGNVASATSVAGPTEALENPTSCPTGYTRCAQLQKVPYQTVESVISVIGLGPDGKTQVALGCAEAMISQAQVQVNITLQRVIPMAKCPDGVVEPTETCDDMTQVCKACETEEELLSFGDTPNSGTSTGSVGQKTNPFFLWGSGSGSAGVFMAVFTDTASGSDQITARFLDDTLAPTTAYGPTVSESSIFVPNSTSAFPPMAALDDDKEPSAATVGVVDYVAFSSDVPTTGDAFDIYFDSFSQSDLTALQSAPCPVNAMNGSTNTAPSIAASGSNLYVAWQDSAGNIRGRLITPGGGCATPGKESVLAMGSNSLAKVAAAGSGWVVAWQTGSGVSMALVDAGGTAGSVQTVAGSGSNPSVASAPGGSAFAVAWIASSGIQVQRYQSNGTIPSYAMGDAKLVVNTGSLGSAPAPAIAGGATTTGSPFFVVTWISASGVEARLIDATSGAFADDSGYLFNTIDGTAKDFQVNVAATDSFGGRTPGWANPTVAVGGGGYIAFGWEDRGSSCSTSVATFPGTPCWGIVARRFPLPTD